MIKKLAAVLTAAVLGILLTGGTALANERQNFTLLTFNYGQTTVIANGEIIGVGTQVFPYVIAELAADEFAPYDYTYDTSFVFDAGAVNVTATVWYNFSYNEVACLGHISGYGYYEITGGTGDYEGATGSGTLTNRGNFVADRDANGNCTFPDAFSYFSEQFSGDIGFGEFGPF